MSKALNPPCGEVRSVPALALGQSRGLTASLLCFPPMVGLPPTILLSSHFLGSGRSVVWPCLACLSLLPCEVGVWPAPCHRKSLGDPSSPGSGGGWGESQPVGLPCVLQTWFCHHPHHLGTILNAAMLQTSPWRWPFLSAQLASSADAVLPWLCPQGGLSLS